ncbi:MAG: anti-sigma factor antagonist [Chrysiogenales bacterium]|nr:MAG: anti-sigma factor antagonist [Chrysiogenales bacterium]
MVSFSSEMHGNVIVLSIRGDFYIESIEYAEKMWGEQMAKRPKVMGINCRDIKYIDSSAIGILVKFLNNAMKSKTELVFFDLSESIIGVFRTAKLGNFFKVMSRTQFEMEYLES